MNKNDIIMVPMSSRQSSGVNEPANNQNVTTTFGRSIKKNMTNKAIIPSPSDQVQYHRQEQETHKALQKFSSKQTNKQAINSIIHIVYVSLKETRVMIASVPKKRLFSVVVGANEAVIVDSKIKAPLDKFMYRTVNYLLNIPETATHLEKLINKKTHRLYNYYRKDIEAPDKKKLHIEQDSIIYTSGDIYELSSILMDLINRWTNSLCIASTEDLMNINKLRELKKNNHLKAMLDNYSLNDSYNFSILANNVMPALKTIKYFNFFNISKDDVEKSDIRNLIMIDIKKV